MITNDQHNSVALPDTIDAGEVCFEADLIRRYDRNGPRYTSYPTAVEFTPACGEQTYRKVSLQSNAPDRRPLSIYVHVPFCTSPCFYCGCNKVITRDTSRATVYLDHLFREIRLQAGLFSRQRPVEQLHLGGGTPTFLSLSQLRQLMDELGIHFGVDITNPAREFSIEIDPRTLRPESLPALFDMGFNRISLGIQDFDPQVQAAVNRRQSAEETLLAIQQARDTGFKSISVDLIYGLPLQTPVGFARTLDRVIAARPDRVAVYGYAHMPHLFKAQRQIKTADIPDPATRLQLLRLSIESLTRAGYRYIGMDHFALPDDELVRAQQSRTLHRNFQGYSTHAECDLVGLGVSAIGKVAGMYAQNAKTLVEYYRLIEQGQLPIQRGLQMTADDQIRHTVIQEIMCHGELRFDDLAPTLSIDFESYFADELMRLQALAADGLLNLYVDGLRVTPRGRLLLRHIAMVFDAYLPKAMETTFSKAI